MKFGGLLKGNIELSEKECKSKPVRRTSSQ